MPVGKKGTYAFMSPKIAEKRKRAKRLAKQRLKNVEEPATISNYEVNKPSHAKSNNASPVLQKKRLISPGETKVAINSRADDKIQKKAITKTRPKVKEVDVTAGAIKVAKKTAKKKTKKKARKTKKIEG